MAAPGRGGAPPTGAHAWTVPAAWYALIAPPILNRFWYHWQTLL